MDERVSIGQVKRDISELVSRIAFGGERIVLPSRGKPKAAPVSMADYQKLADLQTSETAKSKAWIRATNTLSNGILEGRNGELIDVDALLAAEKADLEGRDERIAGRN